jgi:hypothetical protein
VYVRIFAFTIPAALGNQLVTPPRLLAHTARLLALHIGALLALVFLMIVARSQRDLLEWHFLDGLRVFERPTTGDPRRHQGDSQSPSITSQ